MTAWPVPCSQDVPPFVMSDGHPAQARSMNFEGLRRRGFSAGAHRRVKAMHKALYRDGLTLEQARQRIADLRRPRPRRSRRRPDARGSWRPPPARHRALTMDPRVRAGRGRSVRRPAGRPCCWAACEAAGPTCSRPASAARAWRAWLPGLVAARQAGRARLRRGAAPLPRDRGHPPPTARAAAAPSGRRLFIGVDAPDFNLDLEVDLRAGGIKHGALRLPVDLGLARRNASRRSAAPATTSCASFPFEPDLLARHGVAATYVGHPLAAVIPLEPDKAAARAALGLPPEAKSSPSCPAAASLRDPVPGQALLRGGGTGAPRARPGVQFVLPALPACVPPSTPRPRPRPPRRALNHARRPVAPGAGGVRRDADRQRHGDAGSGAVQAADGHRVCDELRSAGASCAQAAAALGGPAQHPVRAVRRAGVAAARRHPRALATSVLEWLEAPARMAAVQQTFTALHERCGATPQHWQRMRSSKSSKVEQGSLPWDPVGLMAGVDEAGRGPLAGPGRRRGRHPGRRQAHPRPRRFQAADALAARSAVRPDLREGAVPVHRPSHGRGDRRAEHLPRHHAGDEARRRRPAAEAGQGAGRRQRAARIEVLAEAIVGGDAKVKSISAASILAKVHARPPVQAAARGIPAVRLCRPQGLRHARAPGGAAVHGACRHHRRFFAPWRPR
jgi:lipid-A-disaccharide synthase